MARNKMPDSAEQKRPAKMQSRASCFYNFEPDQESVPRVNQAKPDKLRESVVCAAAKDD
jgi:hypothetical protein